MQLVGSVMRVFSAHAEVVPMATPTAAVYSRILRARGGSSMMVSFLCLSDQYSPRTRR